MPKRKGQDFPTPEENPRFHDTYQFLRRYRDATYSLKVVVHQMENQFKVQYGSALLSTLLLRLQLCRLRLGFYGQLKPVVCGSKGADNI